MADHTRALQVLPREYGARWEGKAYAGVSCAGVGVHGLFISRSKYPLTADTLTSLPWVGGRPGCLASGLLAALV